MSSLARLRHNWRVLLAAAAALGALALMWTTRAAPLQPAPLVRVDALSAFFSLALLGGTALEALAQPGAGPVVWRKPIAVALLIIAWSTTLTPVVAGLYLLFALLVTQMGDRRSSLIHRDDTGVHPTGSHSGAARQVWMAIRRGVVATPHMVAAGALLVGYGALAAGGALRYDARTAGGALGSFVFWFVLLAAVIPILDFGFWMAELDAVTQSTIENRKSQLTIDIFRIAWLYPLARLYSLGPWNTGWAFAAVLLGGGVALWAASAALTRPTDRRDLAPRSFLGLALAGLGLSTGAGIAAGCYGVLAYLVLVLPSATADQANQEPRTKNQDVNDGSRSGTPKVVLGSDEPVSFVLDPSSLVWLLSGAIPLTAPFVAAWMLVGASVAGGVALLAGAAWLVVLLSGLTAALFGAEAKADRRALLVAAGASAVLGVGAPLVASALIQPVIEQLQGGLTPYGDVNIWPWVGLATIDAAHTPVTTLPSIAVAALMLVLSALIYVISRLRGTWAPGAAQADAPTTGLGALLAGLRDEVPWLGALAPRPADEERHVDGE